MPSLLKDTIRELAANAAMAIPPIRRWRLKRPRMDSPNPFQPLRGVETVLGSVEGKDVIEFGPGDTLSSGLAFLAADAATYTSLDRFAPDYSTAEAKRCYRQVRADWPADWPADLDPDIFPEGYPDRVRALSDSIEDTALSKRFDVVTSWQVGEHVTDIDAFCRLTASLLTPNGVAVHRVDFGPHNWAGYDDPLTFLRFPRRCGPRWDRRVVSPIGTATTNSCLRGRQRAEPRGRVCRQHAF